MITVRERIPADDATLARLLEEMQAHYHRPSPPLDSRLKDLAALPPGVTILVAETDVVVGFAAFAVRNGHKRVDWTADRNDPRLLAYYQDLGAMRQDDKVFFRLTDEALESHADDDRLQNPGWTRFTTTEIGCRSAAGIIIS
jgi:hypothetical protein